MWPEQLFAALDTDDVLVEPLTFENGRIRVPSGPGLGVEVDEAKVEKYREGN